MCKLQIKNRRESTMVRDNEIHKLHKEILAGLGDLANVVSNKLSGALRAASEFIRKRT